MASLNHRISKLEQASPCESIGPMFIHFVGMDNEDEIQRITNGNQAWQRQPNESEQGLKDRAEREVQPPLVAGCITVFLCH